MTTIAWDGRTLAADKRTSFGGLGATTVKVHRAGDRLVAGCGTCALVNEMVDWIRRGCDPNDFPAAQRDEKDCASMLVVGREGPLLQYENTAFPLTIYNKQWAIGSGRDFAITAMHFGKTAREAIEVAALFDATTGNGVDTLELQ